MRLDKTRGGDDEEDVSVPSILEEVNGYLTALPGKLCLA